MTLLKPGLETNDQDTLKEIKTLCMKIYRSTNMRYQTIAKLILRNRSEELRHQVQMNFNFEMAQHMSLVLVKIDV